MDLSFLTGNTQPSVGAFQWANNGNSNMGFNTPAMSYQPDTSLAGSIGGANSTPLTGLSGQLGMNIPTFQLGLGALGSLGNLYGAFQSNRLAKDQFNFTKDITNTNLNNQIKSYNTALEDRARSRAVAENRDSASADAYIERNKLTR